MKSRLSFCRLVNVRVRKDEIFRPLKFFKHAIQTLYSKTIGGVDSSTQHRTILQSASSHLGREQKLVCQVLKSVCANSFLAWRIFERRGLLRDAAFFNCLDSHRDVWNKM